MSATHTEVRRLAAIRRGLDEVKAQLGEVSTDEVDGRQVRDLQRKIDALRKQIEDAEEEAGI